MPLKDADRRVQVVSLWLATYAPEKRTVDNTYAFYGWVRDNRPELIKVKCPDPFFQLRRDLRDHTN